MAYGWLLAKRIARAENGVNGTVIKRAAYAVYNYLHATLPLLLSFLRAPPQLRALYLLLLYIHHPFIATCLLKHAYVRCCLRAAATARALLLLTSSPIPSGCLPCIPYIPYAAVFFSSPARASLLARMARRGGGGGDSKTSTGEQAGYGSLT